MSTQSPGHTRALSKGSRAGIARPELERIEFLLRRDGPEATRIWVERTLRMYQTGLDQPNGHVSDPHYRPLFERAVKEFDAWMAAHSGRQTAAGDQQGR